MKNVYIVYIITIILLFLGCSEMEIKWVKKFDPAGPGNYRINKISSFKKGSTYVIGKYWTADKDPYCITAKYNANGELEWHKIYEKEDLRATEGKSIRMMRTQDDLLEKRWNIYVHVQTTDRANIKNSTFIKYDSLGNLEWERIVEKLSEEESELESVMLTDYADNIYIAGLRTNSKDSINIFITKYNKLGEKIWSTIYYNPNLYVRHVKFDIKKPDQFLIGGVSESTKDFFFIRYDSLGEFMSLTKHQSPEHENILADIQMGMEGNVYLAGTCFSNETGIDYLTLAYDKNDSLLWANRFDGASHMDDIPKAIALDESSNFYVTGSSENRKEVTEIRTLKYDKDGNELWSTTFCGRKNESAEPYFLIPEFLCYGKKTIVSSDSMQVWNFSMVGSIGNDILLLNHSTNGFISWSIRYKGRGKMNKPTAFSKNCVAMESKSEKDSDAILVKYGKTKQFGIVRWD